MLENIDQCCFTEAEDARPRYPISLRHMGGQELTTIRTGLAGKQIKNL